MPHDTPLTKKQQFWLEHIHACDQSGQTMKAYAEEHDLKVSAFYAWKKTLRRKGVIGEPQADAPPLFCKAQVADASHARVLHPSGLVLEFDDSTDPLWVAHLLRALS